MSVYTELLPERIDEFAGRLGRHIEHDERSLEFAVEHLVDEILPPKTVSWQRFSPILDQGNLGSCTGNALAGWLGCSPDVTTAAAAARFDEAFAVSLYSHATALDNVPGTYPPDDTGSTGLAVCKAAKNLGLISAYHHAVTVNGLLHALQQGPVIVGVPWLTGFDRPDEHGVVLPTGEVRGGHEFLIRGYIHGNTEDESMLLADNSWGISWGVGGSFQFSVTTWRALVEQKADVTIPRR